MLGRLQQHQSPSDVLYSTSILSAVISLVDRFQPLLSPVLRRIRKTNLNTSCISGVLCYVGVLVSQLDCEKVGIYLRLGLGRGAHGTRKVRKLPRKVRKLPRKVRKLPALRRLPWKYLKLHGLASTNNTSVEMSVRKLGFYFFSI